MDEPLSRKTRGRQQSTDTGVPRRQPEIVALPRRREVVQSDRKSAWLHVIFYQEEPIALGKLESRSAAAPGCIPIPLEGTPGTIDEPGERHE